MQSSNLEGMSNLRIGDEEINETQSETKDLISSSEKTEIVNLPKDTEPVTQNKPLNQQVKKELYVTDFPFRDTKEQTKIPSGEKKEEKDIQSKGTKESETGKGHQKLYGWLNKNMKIEMTDGRILIGVFLCTDRDGNVILGSCSEYINPEVCGFSDEPRILGLVMVPGRHIVSIHHDTGTPQSVDQEQAQKMLPKE